MMRSSSVPDPDLDALNDQPPESSPTPGPPIRLSLKFLAASSVALVNGAAVLYIVVRLLLAGIRRLTE